MEKEFLEAYNIHLLKEIILNYMAELFEVH